MSASIDLDQLRSFLAVAETGSITRGADIVGRTQSAVSMQMARLAERLGRDVFVREGKGVALSEEGQRLLVYARRMMRLSDTAVGALGEGDAADQRINFGMPDEYVARLLPNILAGFGRSHPKVAVSVQCGASTTLTEACLRGELDLIVVTNSGVGNLRVIRQERMLWVGAEAHRVERDPVIPLALALPSCPWRKAALAGLALVGRPCRIVLVSGSSDAVAAAVLAGLAVTVLPESAMRPGMRVLGEAEGFPRLVDTEIGILRSWTGPASLVVDAFADQVVASLDNLPVARASA